MFERIYTGTSVCVEVKCGCVGVHMEDRGHTQDAIYLS